MDLVVVPTPVARRARASSCGRAVRARSSCSATEPARHRHRRPVGLARDPCRASGSRSRSSTSRGCSPGAGRHGAADPRLGLGRVSKASACWPARRVRLPIVSAGAARAPGVGRTAGEVGAAAVLLLAFLLVPPAARATPTSTLPFPEAASRATSAPSRLGLAHGRGPGRARHVRDPGRAPATSRGGCRVPPSSPYRVPTTAALHRRRPRPDGPPRGGAARGRGSARGMTCRRSAAALTGQRLTAWEGDRVLVRSTTRRPARAGRGSVAATTLDRDGPRHERDPDPASGRRRTMRAHRALRSATRRLPRPALRRRPADDPQPRRRRGPPPGDLVARSRRSTSTRTAPTSRPGSTASSRTRSSTATARSSGAAAVQHRRRRGIRDGARRGAHVDRAGGRPRPRRLTTRPTRRQGGAAGHPRGLRSRSTSPTSRASPTRRSPRSWVRPIGTGHVRLHRGRRLRELLEDYARERGPPAEEGS